ncbi:MAG: nicotinamidase [Helicobacteraceae bacterium]|jgi:nicotinamidase/pyrazinamidase|nr:nicotinamidase [Helicobacteraceae bacterium]
MNKSLIIIDAQNDFADPNGALYCVGGETIIEPINRLMASGEYDLIVATQDWHPQNHLSFAANHAGKKPLDIIDVSYGKQVLWASHCVQDSFGAAFHSRLDTFRFNFIVRKGARAQIDSYSAFFENDKVTSTGLERLFGGGYELDFAGIATDFCVKSSAIDALRLGNKVSVLAGACVGVTAEGAANALDEMRSLGVLIKP